MAFSQKLAYFNPYFHLPLLRYEFKSFCYLTYFLSFLLPFLPTFPQLVIPFQFICVVFASLIFLCKTFFKISPIILATVCIPSALILIWLIFDPSIFFNLNFVRLVYGYFGFVPLYFLFSLVFMGIPYHLRFNYFKKLIRFQVFSVLFMSTVNYFVPTNVIFAHFHNLDLSAYNSTYYGFAGRPTISSGLILCLSILLIILRNRNQKFPLADKILLIFLSFFFLIAKSGFSITMLTLCYLVFIFGSIQSAFVINKLKLISFVIFSVCILVLLSTIFYAKTFSPVYGSSSYFQYLLDLKILSFSHFSLPLIFPNLDHFHGFGQDFSLFFLFENLSVLFAVFLFSLVFLNCSYCNFYLILVIIASLFHYSLVMGPSLSPFLGFFLSFRWADVSTSLKIKNY